MWILTAAVFATMSHAKANEGIWVSLLNILLGTRFPAAGVESSHLSTSEHGIQGEIR